MTPGARVAAAIEVLDRILTGDAAERVLTTWGRQNRFAGSGDRAAIRDLVFDALRQLGSSAARGGGMTGRQVMIGLLRAQGGEPDALFTGIGHAPPPLTPAERDLREITDPDLALDCPAWLAPALRRDLGADFAAVMGLLQQRAALFLRVNLRLATMDVARSALADEGIPTDPGPLSPTVLRVTGNPRKVQASRAYRDGLVEVQDAASQAVSDALPVQPGQRVLDFCAGGGGKSLALAARVDAHFFAHDAEPRRMVDLPARARRAGVEIALLTTAEAGGQAPFDLVFADAPCSGSGAWRRSPQSKWDLDAARLDVLCRLQSVILAEAAALVAPDGRLAYLTCSLLTAENDARIAEFIANFPDWSLQERRALTPLDGGDGFFLAILGRTKRVASDPRL